MSAAGDLQTKMLPSAAHVTMFFPSGLMRTCAHPFTHTAAVAKSGLSVARLVDSLHPALP